MAPFGGTAEMAQIPILNGVYTSNAPDYRIAYPVNLVPVALSQGVSGGYLKPAEGIVSQGTGTGETRGMINWNNELYAVQGTDLVSIAQDGTVLVLGTVADGGPVRFTYSFERLAVASGNRLYYWDGSTLVEVTDPLPGLINDVVWINGYFMTTNGEDLWVSTLADPTNFDPNNFASNEANPDPIVALLRLRNEVVALNRYTIEVFTGRAVTVTAPFPFERIEGAQIQKGCVGTHACCVFLETIAFVGSGFNEAPGVYLGTNGNANKVSTIEVDKVLASFTEAQLSNIVVECRNDSAHQHLYIHLPDRTLVFDAAVTRELEQGPVWFTLTSSTVGFAEYRARFFTWCYDRWMCGEPSGNEFGYLVEETGEHYGDVVRWEFSTKIIYNEGRGAIVNDLELVALTGRVALGASPVLSTSWSADGQQWSQDNVINAGSIGQRAKRLTWFRQGSIRDQRIQRFRGHSDAHVSFARLEANMQPLNF
jgi:hypothetical protein